MDLDALLELKMKSKPQPNSRLPSPHFEEAPLREYTLGLADSI